MFTLFYERPLPPVLWHQLVSILFVDYLDCGARHCYNWGSAGWLSLQNLKCLRCSIAYSPLPPPPPPKKKHQKKKTDRQIDEQTKPFDKRRRGYSACLLDCYLIIIIIIITITITIIIITANLCIARERRELKHGVYVRETLWPPFFLSFGFPSILPLKQTNACARQSAVKLMYLTTMWLEFANQHPESTIKKQKPINLCASRDSLKQMCGPCLIIMKSCYFDYSINKLSTQSHCSICASHSVHVISTYYVRKGL